MDFSILTDIVIIFGLSTGVNYLFTKIKLPTLIGYLLTGIVAGPHLLKLIESEHEIELMAEIGVVLLMFTIGLEFSIKHLMKIRRVVFLGGLMQFIITAGSVYIITNITELDASSRIFMGFLVALSSTAIVLKLLQDRSELTSYYGRTVLGVLIFQDIIVVPLMLLTPILGGQTQNLWDELMWLGIKSTLIMAMVYVGHKWVMPKVLHMIALTKNQELFLMAILLFCLSIAILTASMGMSLAFGAFLGGLMIAESNYSHTAFGNLIPFKDTFTSFFFVSIGMLLDLNFVAQNWEIIVASVVVIITLKSIIAGGTAFVLGHSFVGTLTVGMALSQVGEFSFILAQQGARHGLISDTYFQIFLSVAVISMIISPFLIQSSHTIAKFFLKFPLPKWWVNGLFPVSNAVIPEQQKHIVIIGKDLRSENLAKMIRNMQLPYIPVVFDPAQVQERQNSGEHIVYGDATNEAVLKSAYVQNADFVVISVGNLIASMAIIDKVRHLNNHTYILVRTKNVTDINELYNLGANQVLPEKFETAIDLFEQLLKKKLVPRREIATQIAQLRDKHYGAFMQQNLNQDSCMPIGLPNIEIVTVRIENNSEVAGKSLYELMLRKNYGITLVAIQRGEELIEHPDSHVSMHTGDIAYIMGRSEQIENAYDIFLN